MLKVLIIRFSSIGDVVLTTPIIRCVKQQLHKVEVHYVTKKSFSSILSSNPYIDKLYTINTSVFEITADLKKENYDYVIDLHNNLRTLKLKLILGKKSFSFNKLNWEKFLITAFKINKLPNTHIVDRCFDAIKTLGVANDLNGLDYFIPNEDKINTANLLPTHFINEYAVLVIGGSYYTKKIPLHKLKQICEQVTKPLVLLGGKDDVAVAAELHQAFKHTTLNLCGVLNLNQSASVIQQSQNVITSDTGLMHIAAAFKKSIISIWGNTIPQFGMSAYLPGPKSQQLQTSNLSCRPCSKLGYSACPKSHFKCMNDIDVTLINFN